MQQAGYSSKTKISDASLTLRQGVIDAEAAQYFINIAGLEESISSDHYLKRLCEDRHFPENCMESQFHFVF